MNSLKDKQKYEQNYQRLNFASEIVIEEGSVGTEQVFSALEKQAVLFNFT
ncbi:hypothetical protein GCM10008027_12730 [Pseudoalteromonas gelatinilytica]|jgi:tetrahydrodipicolinate N-succinyltransferase|uniref:Uncharacterized protein n=1 Tax=Pseudoalteromonas gelatinilytica TaxID=1703256 RepID=A0ABQ1TA76_9GAMM|nr:hypothetical protein GCM10008027_12730 [Pseudoalteromonas profundi]